MTIEENFSPSPVSVTTPTMMPAVAQVVAAVSTLIEPSAIARTSFVGTSDVSRVKKLMANVMTVAQNTDSVGEKPQIMKMTTATSEMKWKPYRRVNCQSERSCATSTIWAWNFLASSSTMI